MISNKVNLKKAGDSPIFKDISLFSYDLMNGSSPSIKEKVIELKKTDIEL